MCFVRELPSCCVDTLEDGIAKGIGMQVIAVGVQSAREIDLLAQLGFDGVTGPAVRETD